MGDITKICKLESLNDDVLISILYACESFKDLSSFIEASPAMLRAFISVKATLLLALSSTILGPAVRDAAVLLQTGQIRSSSDEEHDRIVDAVVEDYAARLCAVDEQPWLRPPHDMSAVVALAQIARIVQFYIELFVQSRFPLFADKYQQEQIEQASATAATNVSSPQQQPTNTKHKNRHPGVSLSRMERGRLAQALIRRQIILDLHGHTDLEASYPQLARPVFSLFQPWELAQIADMDYFMGGLLGALFDAQRVETEYMRWHALYAADMQRLAARLTPNLESVGSLLRRRREQKKKEQPQGIPVHEMHLLFWMFEGSHHVVPPCCYYTRYEPAAANATTAAVARSDRHRRRDEMMSRRMARPWAWTDALGGLENTCAWGCDVVRVTDEPPPGSAAEQDLERAKTALATWRWFGMVFWDRERSEMLKQLTALKSCQTTWLVPWQGSTHGSTLDRVTI